MKCQLCGSQKNLEHHHLFSQGTKKGWRRRIYGKLLDDPLNMIWLCEQCHKWKPLPKISEKEFCSLLKIKTRSKMGSYV